MTDRTLRRADDLDTLDFAKVPGLVPVVAQDAVDGRVLMVAYATREALSRSLESGRMHFWSRSRRALWQKGETSGNVLDVVSLHADCDGDTVLARVRPTGPACHTGEWTCFGDGAEPDAATSPPDGSGAGSPSPEPTLGGALEALSATVDTRQRERPEGSYTVLLLDDDNLRLKKLGEETTELVMSLAAGGGAQVAEEAADLLYHLLVALRGAGVDTAEVAAALERRRR